MSREHWLSEAILEKINANGKLTVRGYEKITKGAESKIIPPNALAAKILCSTHNSALSVLDAEATRFFDALFECWTQIPTAKRAAPTQRLDGLLIQRWALKYLCGLIASGHGRDRHGNEVPRAINDLWVRRAFGLVPHAPNSGLFLHRQVTNEMRKENLVRSVLLHRTEEESMPVGFDLIMNNLRFRYTTETDRKLASNIGKPGRITFRYFPIGATRSIRLEWGKRARTAALDLEVGGP